MRLKLCPGLKMKNPIHVRDYKGINIFNINKNFRLFKSRILTQASEIGGD
jgi:hypothetical protein